MTRIAITGVGVVAPGATGISEFASFLHRSQSAAAAVDRFDTSAMHAHHAALIRDFKARDFIAPMKLRRMNTLSRYALAAARMALDDRGEPLPSTSGVALGTAFGPVQTSVEYMKEYVEKGPALAPPQLFAESVANAPGSHIAIEFDYRGFNITLTQRESSALAAAMYASTQIVKGAVGAAMVGGVDEVNEMLFSVLDRIGALGRSGSCPFDRGRSGTMMGEGAAVLVVESAPRDRTYAYFSGFGVARDTTASISDWGEDPDAVARAMRNAIDDAELTIGDIDAIYASANSSVRGDRLEYRAIQSLFAAVPPVVATKGYFGEYAAGGALQLVAAALAVRDQTLHASIGFEEGEPEMTFVPTPEERSTALRHVLVNSISAGGGIVSAVLSREAS